MNGSSGTGLPPSLGGDGPAHELFRTFLESAPDAIVIVGEDGRIVLVNTQAEALLGYGRVELVGHSIKRLLPARFRDVHAAHARSAFLADAGRLLLGEALDIRSRLERLAHLAVPRLADQCIVDLLDRDDDDAAIQRIAVVHVDPAKAALTREIQRRRPSRVAEAIGGYRTVVREQRAQLVPEVTDAMLRTMTSDAELLALIRAVGPRSYMFVPLVARGRTRGVITLAVGDESGRRYAAADLMLAEELAQIAAVTIDNADLYQEAQAAIIREQAARADLEQAQHHIISATEALRREIAERLHGPVQTRMLVAWHELGECERLLETDLPAARAALTAVRADLDHIREHEVREASHALHPAIIEMGVVPAIESLTDRFADCFTADVEVDPAFSQFDDPVEQPLSGALALAIYRVVEEALANSYRHGRATAVTISLRLRLGREVTVLVRDNGRGCDPTALTPGVGLSSIGGRVGQFGGSWAITGAPGRGTTLRAVFPFDSQDSRPALAGQSDR
jgi:signal transduction histidine kinase